MYGSKTILVAALAAVLTVAGAGLASAGGTRIAPNAFAGVAGGYETQAVHYRRYRRGHRHYGRGYRRGHRHYGHRRYRRHRYYGRRHYRHRRHGHYRPYRRYYYRRHHYAY